MSWFTNAYSCSAYTSPLPLENYSPNLYPWLPFFQRVGRATYGDEPGAALVVALDNPPLVVGRQVFDWSLRVGRELLDNAAAVVAVWGGGAIIRGDRCWATFGLIEYH